MTGGKTIVKRNAAAGWVICLAMAVGVSAGTSALGAAKKPAKKMASGNAAVIANGKKFVTADGCSGCHKIGGVGGTTGPDLSHEGSKAKAAEIAAKIKNPKEHNPNSIMPASKRSAKDIAAMAAYLASLK
jgi:mono/diheme cytochrome c family protein